LHCNKFNRTKTQFGSLAKPVEFVRQCSHCSTALVIGVRSEPQQRSLSLGSASNGLAASFPFPLDAWPLPAHATAWRVAGRLQVSIRDSG